MGSNPSQAQSEGLVRGYLEDIWTYGDFDAIDRFVAAEPRFYGISGEGMDRESLGHVIRDTRDSVPDLEKRITAILVDGAYVTATYRLRGTFEHEFLGVDLSGESFEVEGAFRGQIADGMIVGGTDLWDVCELFRRASILSGTDQ